MQSSVPAIHRNAFCDSEGYRDTLFHAYLAADPLAYIDIGARGGEHAIVEPMASATRILAFEPDAAECTRLETELKKNSPWASIEIIARALAGTNGPATLHHFKSPLNDSLRAANPHFVSRYRVASLAPNGQSELTTTTLDDLLSSENRFKNGHGDFVKVDAQGADLDILRASTRMLSEQTVALLVEVEFCDIYLNQPHFSEVEIFLRSQGFVFYGFHGTNHRSHRHLDKSQTAGRERMIWADAIFFKDPLDKEPALSLSPRSVTALMASACMLGYHDFAIELAEKLFSGDSRQKSTVDFIRRFAAISSREIADSVKALQKSIEKNSDNRSPLVALGKFIDSWRRLPNYDEFPNS
jgi:FkbM family methyltransferase